MRLVDVLFSFTEIVIALACLAILGVGLTNAMIAIGIASIPFYARITHSVVLVERSKPYFEAAVAGGAGHLRLIFRHLLPNVVPTLIVVGTLGISTAVLAAAGLSFLGLGAQPPQPEWGFMLSSSRDLISKGALDDDLSRASPSRSPCSASTSSATASARCSTPASGSAEPWPSPSSPSKTSPSPSATAATATRRSRTSPTPWARARRSPSSAKAAPARASPAWRCSASCPGAVRRWKRAGRTTTATTSWPCPKSA
jgi:hypothetical protein